MYANIGNSTRFNPYLSLHMIGFETKKLSPAEAAYRKLMAAVERGRFYVPERIIFNDPATIAFWPDGTKTVVKCQDGEPFDPEKGIAMAILKKIYGGGKYNDMLRKLIEEASTCNEQKKS